jgi:hypothetical protein
VTETVRYVLPMLYSKDRNDSFFITKNFENCYIGDGNHPELGRKIFLLYNYQMSIEYVKFERKMELMSEFDTDYDYGDERQVMYVLNIPEEHTEDLQHFLKGEYSQFSDELKVKILKFWGIKNEETLFYGTLYANNAAKENLLVNSFDNAPDEYWPKPVLSREIYMNPTV